MALDTYSNLKASIIKWSHREDVSPIIDDFINIAESEMYGNSVDPIKLRAMEARATAEADTSSRFLALPDRFLGMRRLSTVNASGNTDIVYMAPEQLQVPGVSGQPRFFTVTTQLEFDKTPDTAYTVEMAYLAKFLPLDETNNTNLILTDFPNIYLYGSLWALFQYAADEEKAE